MKSAITWFEIPTTDLARAATFYEKVLGATLRRDTFMGVPHAFFGSAETEGALIEDPKRKPSMDGGVVYLAVPELGKAVATAKREGGAVVVDVTDIGDPGAIALVRDTEGNLVGLHQTKPRG